ncbi:MAG: S9 family peptidase, partial [Spirochaetes bacterium]|nr:S9 family peptidase [Spirochaetota bacterium]
MYDFPETRKDQTVDVYHGKSIADPYRWLEDDNSAETKAWVSAQNCVTEEYLAMVPERGRWRKRLAELWNFEKFGLPQKHGPYYFSFYNSGLWNQPALYISPSYADRGRLLLDPNNLSSDGTVSLSAIAPSPDGKLLAYAQAEAGSDWVVWKILDTASGKQLPDQIRWCKNGSVAWLGDGSGFFYSRFAEPAADAELTALNKGQSVWLHRMGSNQAADTLVYERPDQSEWYLYPTTSDDHKWLIIYASPGCNPETGIFIKDLRIDDSPVEPFLADFDAAWQVIDSTEERWILLTNQAAGRQRLLSITPGNSDRSQWQELVAEDPEGRVLDAAHCCGQSILALYMTDARAELRVFDRSGANMRKVELPGIGTISESCGQRESNEAFILFSSFARPSSLYRFDGSSSALSLASAPSLAFKPDDFVTSQVFYPSKDGTRIPLFIAHRRGLQIHKDTPALLY